MDPTLAAYVGESVVLRYDPRDVAEMRVFYQDRFLCRAICQELAGATVPLRDIMKARNRQRRELRQIIQDREQMVESLLHARREDIRMQPKRRTHSRHQSLRYPGHPSPQFHD
jgi:putative transposase